MTKSTRRQALTLAAAVGAAVLGLGTAWGTTYPEKPVRMVIPIAPGGQTDVVARLLQLTIDKRMLLPQPIVVINNAAAGGTTGTRQVKDSEPDGYTIGVFHMGLLTAPAMGVVDYDHDAFELIGQIGGRRSAWAGWPMAGSKPSRTCSPRPRPSPTRSRSP